MQLPATKPGAIADYTYAIILAPDSSMAYSNRGVSRAAIADYQGAIADYTKAIELKPNSTNAYLNRASLRAKLGDNKGANADYKKLDSLFLQQGEKGYHQEILERIQKLNAVSK